MLLVPVMGHLFFFASDRPRREPLGHLRVSDADARDLEKQSELAVAREKLLAIELGGEVPAWAGTYRFDEQDVEWIVIAPRYGAVLATRALVGQLHERVRLRNHGEVEEIAPGRLRVRWRVPPETMSTFHAGRRVSYGGDLIVVPWGQRDVLVPVDRMIEFCERVADGSEWDTREERRRFATRLVPGRDEDERAPWPVVPQEFRGYLHTPDLTTAVVEAVPADWRQPADRSTLGHASVARLGVGRADGVLPGMTFFWPWNVNYAEGEVTELAEKSCTVEFRHGAFGDSFGPPLSSGTLVSTRRPAYYARDRR